MLKGQIIWSNLIWDIQDEKGCVFLRHPVFVDLLSKNIISSHFNHKNRFENCRWMSTFPSCTGDAWSRLWGLKRLCKPSKTLKTTPKNSTIWKPLFLKWPTRAIRANSIKSEITNKRYKSSCFYPIKKKFSALVTHNNNKDITYVGQHFKNFQISAQSTNCL